MADKVSIIIPSLGRKESLDKCVASIRANSYKDYEILLVTEEGSLTNCRNLGARKSSGNILAFIDDDTEVHPKWLRFMVQAFKEIPKVGGVTGPAIIRPEYRKNRELLRYERLYKACFLRGVKEPGKLSQFGAISLVGSTDCGYGGEVDYLEACNMAFTRSAFEQAGGFDDRFTGVGDWSETDICFKVRNNGYKLWFDPNIRLYHNPSPNRLNLWKKGESARRYSNYCLFSQRWIKPSIQHSIYKLFIRSYYASKTLKRFHHSKA